MNKFNLPERIFSTIAALLCIFLFVSCGENPSKFNHSPGLPVIDHVKSNLQSETFITKARAGETVMIVGRNLKSTSKILFNGTEAHIYPALDRYGEIIVTIDKDTPFKNASDSLVIINGFGSASFPFHIIQPPPVITDFEPETGSAGDVLTIYGEVFVNVDSVRFGEQTGKLAQIKSTTPEQIKTIIPDGIFGSMKIHVFTSGGSAVSEGSFTAKSEFKVFVYRDNHDAFTEAYGPWTFKAYKADYNYQSTEHAIGTHSIKVSLNKGYGALQIGAFDDAAKPVNLTDIRAIRFSIYAGPGITKLGVVLNGNYSKEPIVQVTPGKWTTITVPLSELGNPSQVTEIVIHGRGTIGTFYVDKLGFI